MSDLLDRVIVGNVVFYPALKEFLKKSYYYMSYDPTEEVIKFSANHGGGGQDLFEVRNVSYENAQKLAEELGLNSSMSGRTTSWAKWNPVYKLWHDGSEDAEKIRIEMLRLGMSFNLVQGGHRTDLNGQSHWAWCSNCTYTPPMWSPERVIEIIQHEADLYKKQLSTTP